MNIFILMIGTNTRPWFSVSEKTSLLIFEPYGCQTKLSDSNEMPLEKLLNCAENTVLEVGH